MNDINYLQDLLQTEIKNQDMYNKHMLHILHPEVRQMMMHMRDGKMQQISQLQKQIQNMMASGKY